jgi:hypothetical protein
MGETRVNAVDQARTIIFGCLERDILTMHGRLAANVRNRERRSSDDDSWSPGSVALMIFCVVSFVAVIVYSLGCFAPVCQ